MMQAAVFFAALLRGGLAQTDCADTEFLYIDGPRMPNNLHTTGACSSDHDFNPQAAQQKCSGDPDCTFIHDFNCDGTGWRTCTGSIGELQAAYPGTRACTQLPHCPPDRYLQECWSAGECKGDGADECGWCGRHHGAAMHCCRADWPYDRGHPCHRTTFTLHRDHQCVTPVPDIRFEQIRLGAEGQSCDVVCSAFGGCNPALNTVMHDTANAGHTFADIVLAKEMTCNTSQSGDHELAPYLHTDVGDDGNTTECMYSSSGEQHSCSRSLPGYQRFCLCHNKVVACEDGHPLVPVDPDMCPSSPEVLATCDKAVPGDVCESDGECMTNPFLDNCGAFDVYQKRPLSCADGYPLSGVAPSMCPPGPGIESCMQAAPGEMCAGAGACGTDTSLNNCGDLDVYQKWAVPDSSQFVGFGSCINEHDDKQLLASTIAANVDACASACENRQACTAYAFGSAPGVAENCSLFSEGPYTHGDGSSPTVCYSLQLPIRLVGAGWRTPVEGRLEVYHAGKWGTVCNDFFSITSAQVACRQLGRSGGQLLPPTAFESGIGQIWMDAVACAGDERHLQDCSHRGWGVHYCQHGEDVNLLCGGDEDCTSYEEGPRVGNGIFMPHMSYCSASYYLFETAQATCNEDPSCTFIHDYACDFGPSSGGGWRVCSGNITEAQSLNPDRGACTKTVIRCTTTATATTVTRTTTTPVTITTTTLQLLPSGCAPGYAKDDGDCKRLCTDDFCSDHGHASGFEGSCTCQCEPGWQPPRCSRRRCSGRCVSDDDLNCGVLGQGYNILASDPFSLNDPGLTRKPVLDLAGSSLCVEANDHDTCDIEETSSEIKDWSTYDTYMSASFGSTREVAGETLYSVKVDVSASFKWDETIKSTLLISKAKCLTSYIGFTDTRPHFPDSFTERFVAKVNAASAVEDFEDIIAIHGTHVIWSIDMGGLLFVSTRTADCFTEYNLAVQVSAEAVMPTWEGGAESQVSVTKGQESNQVKSKINFFGGSQGSLQEWQHSLHERPHMVGRGLLYLGALMPEAKQALWDLALNRIRNVTPPVLPSVPEPPAVSCPESVESMEKPPSISSSPHMKMGAAVAAVAAASWY